MTNFVYAFRRFGPMPATRIPRWVEFPQSWLRTEGGGMNAGTRTNCPPAGTTQARVQPVRAGVEATPAGRAAATRLVHNSGRLSTGSRRLCTSPGVG